MRHMTNKDDGQSRWLKGLVSRKHHNIAVVALANKTARMAWALVYKNVDYNESLAAA